MPPGGDLNLTGATALVYVFKGTVKTEVKTAQGTNGISLLVLAADPLNHHMVRRTFFDEHQRGKSSRFRGFTKL